MSSTIDQLNATNSRDDILLARKDRKKAEKEERELRKYEEKLQKLKGPKDQKVQMIDEKFLEKYKLAQNSTPLAPPPPNSTQPKKRAKQVLKYKNVIQIDLADCIQEKIEAASQEKNLVNGQKTALPPNEIVKHKKKKEREVPKEKNPSKLKKNIINVREQKKEQKQNGCANNDNKEVFEIDEKTKLGPNIKKKEVVEEENLSPFLKAIQKCCQKPDLKDVEFPEIKHSRNFRPFCDHIITPDLLKISENLLSDLFRFQNRAYEKNQIKAVANKRYVVGFNQVLKYAEVGTLKFVLIAPDMEPNNAIDEIVENLKIMCKEKHISYAFTLKRRKIGFILMKKVPISCVGIFNYDGTSENVKKILSLVKTERENYNRINKNTRH